jgi:DMSO/TMAO reductase YedYZ molybdopterin-dependent catalytic subunit
MCMRISAILSLAILLALLGGAAPLTAPTALAQSQAPAVADTFQVDGLVAQPRSFTHDDLAPMSTWSMPVVFAAGQQVQSGTFTGPSLLQVIQAAGGPVFDASRNNDLLRKFIVATGADGYAVVLAWAEIGPEFAAEPVLVAFERDGQPLREGQGMARLVVPGDKRAGRHVNRLTRIEVRDAGTPAQ